MSEGNSVLDYVKYVISTCAYLLDYPHYGLDLHRSDHAGQRCSPGLAFCTLWISVLWLTMVEEAKDHWSVLLPSIRAFQG
jgi:hypothetical protein